ncbi:hypothetical protein HDU87_005693 [Geranomyces variabilis]|uniref:3-phytase n=1 Tax=Geranomyces variabilis TaxID=109894 RepID=A0AAD5TI22_9FUNG|nr:hypothetical protein HDU87_005693 [Geranomyces variabilis]
MLVASFVFSLATLAPSALAAPIDPNATVTNIELPPYFRTMGGFTPWGRNTQGYGIADQLPAECTVDQVTLLSRHGMRYASTGTGKGTQTVVDRIRNATFEVRDPALAFLKTHRYDLPVELLTDWGRRDLVLAGQTFAKRYAALIAGNQESVPLRTTTLSRMLDSATSFAQGFTQSQPGELHWTVVPDASPVFNTTLAVGTCKADKLGIYAPVANVLPAQWAAVYVPPITARLNAALPGLNLTDNEVMSLQSGCPFETVTHNAVSPLCGIFTPSEWADYSYYQDLQQYTSAGYGGPLGRAWGVGWVNELIARLTDSPVVDHTSTNTTMDADPATFPLGRSVYLDFAHDTQLNSAIAVIGLLKDKEGVITGSARNEDRKWKIPNIAEMGGRLWVERVSCKSQPAAPNKCSPGEKLDGMFVRLVLNEAVLPLDIAQCTTNAARAKDAGLCKLADFVESQSFARTGRIWANCDYSTLDEWMAAGSPM